MDHKTKALLATLLTITLLFSGKTPALACDYEKCPVAEGVSLYQCSLSDCNDCPGCPEYNPPGGKEGKNIGTFEGLGPLGKPAATEQDPGASTFTNFISKAIGIMTVVAFIWFIFVLFSGAIAWLSSGGDKQKLQNAQKQITTALTGLLIVISAIFLMKLVETFFGINILGLTELITGLK